MNRSKGENSDKNQCVKITFYSHFILAFLLAFPGHHENAQIQLSIFISFVSF